MNNIFIRIIKFVAEIAIVAVILMAIIIGLARAFFPHLDHYRPFFEKTLSQAVQQPITIEKIEASWRGLYPTIYLSNVCVFDRSKSNALIKVQHLDVGFNFLSSLMHWRVVPSSINISNSQFVIHQIDKQNFDINGIQTHFESGKSNNHDIQNILEWFSKQGQLSLQHVDIDFYNQKGIQFPFTNLQLKIQDRLFEKQLIGLGTLALSTPSQFRFVLKVRPKLIGGLQAQGYFMGKNIDLGLLSDQIPWTKFSIRKGLLPKIQVWLNWNKNHIETIQTLFQLQNAQIQYRDALEQTQAQENPAQTNAAISGNILWQNHQNLGWSVAGNQLQISINKMLWPTHNFGLHYLPMQRTEVATADAIDLKLISLPVLNLGILNADTKEIISQLKPKGLLSKFTLQYTSFADSAFYYHVTTQLKEVEVEPWKNIPGVQHLNGTVDLNPQLATLKLQGENLVISAPKLAENPLQFDQYQTAIQWKKTAQNWSLVTENSSLKSKGLDFQGSMHLNKQAQDAAVVINLQGRFNSADVSLLHNYVPDISLKPELAKWLKEAFVKGRTSGTINLAGPLNHFPFADNSGHFNIDAITNNLELNFKSGWPHITDLNSNVIFNGPQFSVSVDSAKIYEQPVQNLHAEIPDLRNSILNIQGNIAINTLLGSRFVLESPLAETMGDAFRSFSLDAPMNLDLALNIPLSATAEVPLKVKGDAVIGDGTLAINGSPIKIEQVHGNLQFTESGVASSLTGYWLGNPLNIDLGTQTDEAGQSTIKLQADSKVQIEQLAKLAEFPQLNNYATGETAFVAGFEIKKINGETKTVYSLDTDLEGTELKLPQPLAKTADAKTPLHVAMQFADNKTLIISGNYNNQLKSLIGLEKNAAGKLNFKTGNIRLGGEDAMLPKTPGLTIDGHMAQLDSTELSNYVAGFSKSSKGESSVKLNKINLSFNELILFGMKLNQATVTALTQAGGWNIQINSPAIAGQITIPQNFRQAGIQGVFQRFFIDAAMFVKGNSSSINPGKIPPLNLQVQNLVYGQRSFGQVNLVSAPAGNSMQIQKLTARLPDFNLTATGQWEGYGKNHATVLNGTFSTQNMGNALKSWQVTGSLMGAAGDGRFNLKWPGPAYSPVLAGLNGSFSFSLNRGQIINIGESSQREMGIGRILNILSLQSLPRRLTLDFSDFTSGGFPFDSMQGDFNIQNGNAITSNTNLKSSIAAVATTGRIGLGTQDYDLRITLIPHLTGSLPVAATIVGGPVVGAAAWVANKVVGPVVGHITSATYKVTGPWANPNIVKAD